ncbi:MAG: phage major capsid protein [Chloroflexi bacterium]|nr:phage major capsid protein [Chloroflexota bacterium]
MADWRVGADRELKLIHRDSWDGYAAKANVFRWAGFDGDEPDPARARRAFLIYDADEPELKGSYKLPFADVVNGELVAVDAALPAAASRLPQTDAPQDVLDRARAVLDHYFEMRDEQTKGAGAAAATEVLKKALERLEQLKVGARHTGSEYEMLNQIHDLAVGLGAKCECAPPPTATRGAGANHMNKTTKGRRLAAHLNELIDAMVTDEMSRADIVMKMADAAGIEASTVNQILEGDIIRPPDERLRGFAEVLDASLEELQELADADDEANKPTFSTQPQATKGLSLSEIQMYVGEELWKLLEPQPVVPTTHWYVIDVYPEYAVVDIDGAFWRIPYMVSDTMITLAPRSNWEQVTSEWVEARHMNNTVVAYGGEIKAVGDGVIEGYLVRFGGPEDTDLVTDYFDARTDFGPHRKTLVYYDHGLDLVVGIKRLGPREKLAGLKIDEVGVWIQAQLDLRDEYERAIYDLARRNKMGWSSGTASHLVKRVPVNGGKAHWIASWPLGLDASITPTPAEPRNAVMAGKKVLPLKSYQQQVRAGMPGLKALMLQAAGEAATADATGDGGQPAGSADTTLEEELPVNKDELKALLSEVVDEMLKPVVDDLAGVKKALNDEPPANGLGFNTGGDDGGGDEKTFKAFYQARFTGADDEEVKGIVMNEVAGGNYARFVWEQNAAFAKYLRGGTDLMDLKEIKLLKVQVFAPSHVLYMIRQGYDVKSVKDTMVEAQGTLGGFALPPNMQENIATRLPGLTAVRGNGARQIMLIRGNAVDAPKYSGGDDRYVGNIRGQWGAETQDPPEQNATLEQDTIIAHIYTYKIPMSQSLVEDAANLVDLVEEDIQDTLAIDEDDVNLTGDGAGKPLGILPGGVNTLALKEVISGNASALTTNGIKKLKRGVASQYRSRGVFVANSDTYGAVEVLTVSGTGSDFAFPDLSESGQLLRRPTAESEAMPDIAAGAFPIAFGDMGGYWIVEKPGLTVARFQDSKTGINKVELHVRKRQGGRLVELWRVAVQKVAA